jgi:hypothetical protein
MNPSTGAGAEKQAGVPTQQGARKKRLGCQPNPAGWGATIQPTTRHARMRRCFLRSCSTAARATETIPLYRMSPSALHEVIMQRFEDSQPPPSTFLRQLSRKAQSRQDAANVLEAHEQYVLFQRTVGLGHITGLVNACIRGKDWDSLYTALADSRRLQLFFEDSRELSAAFAAMAEAGEWERLEQLHALLPAMAIERVRTTKLHYIVVRALVAAGEAEAAARALDAALGMAEKGEAHAVRLATFAPLVEAQVAAGDAAAAGRTLCLAGATIGNDDRATTAAVAGNSSLPRLLVSAAQAALLEANGASPGEENDDSETGGDGTTAIEATEEEEVASELENEVATPRRIAADAAVELLSKADADARADARKRLGSLGLELSELPEEVRAALS